MNASKKFEITRSSFTLFPVHSVNLLAQNGLNNQVLILALELEIIIVISNIEAYSADGNYIKSFWR